MFLGHKSRCFDVRVNGNGARALSASEDGTCKLWDIESKALQATLIHDSDSEVLRAVFLSTSENEKEMVVSCGSNGKAIVWRMNEETSFYQQTLQLAHTTEQIYVCEAVLSSPIAMQAHLMTADEESVYIWNLDSPSFPLLTKSFASLSTSTQGFGGDRNPENKVFIFDCKFAPQQSSVGANSIGAALSDGNNLYY